jgi:hypothetical protein
MTWRAASAWPQVWGVEEDFRVSEPPLNFDRLKSVGTFVRTLEIWSFVFSFGRAPWSEYARHIIVHDLKSHFVSQVPPERERERKIGRRFLGVCVAEPGFRPGPHAHHARESETLPPVSGDARLSPLPPYKVRSWNVAITIIR